MPQSMAQLFATPCEKSSSSSNPDSQMPLVSPPFVFITTTETSRNGIPSSEARRVARKHVITKYHTLKRSLPLRQTPWTKLSVDCQASGQVGSFRLEGHDRRGRKFPAKKRAEIKDENEGVAPQIVTLSRPPSQNAQGGNFIDPFGATALQLDRGKQELIQHFKTNIPNGIHPINSYTKHSQVDILTISVADEALLHAILAFATFNKIAFHSGQSSVPSKETNHTPVILFHKTQAMQLMNKNMDSGVVSDAMIATTLILQLEYPWIENDWESDIHFSALSKLIQHRGGLESLPLRLSKPISFYDRRRSMLRGTKPQFRLIISPLSRSELAVPDPSTTSIFTLDPSPLESLLGATLCSIFVDLRCFTDFIGYYRIRGSLFGDHESSIFESWNSSLEYRLASVDTKLEASLLADNLTEALRFAAILWMSTGLWHFPLSTSVVRANVKRLVDTLELCDLPCWWSICPDLVIWILVVGACCTPIPGPKRSALLRQLETIAAAMELTNQFDFETTLKRVIWMDGVYQHELRGLWRDKSHWSSGLGPPD